MLIGALLRVPAQAIHRRIINDLNAAGFADLRLPHMAVLQFPGPDGVRPSGLAERAGVSKQAMNQLLRSLEVSAITSGLMGSTGAARDLSASPAVDTPPTRKFTTSSATSNANGAPRLGPSASRSSRSCCRFCGRACRLASRRDRA